MCYYSLRRSDIAVWRGSAMSALVNFIRYQMKVLHKNQATVASIAEISESSLSYILNKKPKKDGDQVRPEPATLKGIAKALEVHPSVLTALLGYPTEPIPNVDERLYELARQLMGAPWVADRLGDLLLLPQAEFEELITWLEFQKSRSVGSENQSKP